MSNKKANITPPPEGERMPFWKVPVGATFYCPGDPLKGTDQPMTWAKRAPLSAIDEYDRAYDFCTCTDKECVIVTQEWVEYQMKLNEDNPRTELLAPSEDQTRTAHTDVAAPSTEAHPLKFVLEVLEEQITLCELNLTANTEYQSRLKQLYAARWLLEAEERSNCEMLVESMTDLIKVMVKEKN